MDREYDPNYYQVIDEIYHSDWTVEKRSQLEILKQVVNQLWPDGHPSKLIQVAGTSGKGSVCRFIEAGLSLYATAGTFTSPHLFDFRERFTIQGDYVEEREIIEIWEKKLRSVCVNLQLDHKRISFYAISLLIALYLFEMRHVEWGIIETGIGGRYSQASVLEVEATILTNVGDDHQHILGHKQWQRALDKAGMARPQVPFFSSVDGEEASWIVRKVCDHIDAPLYELRNEDVEQVDNFFLNHENLDLNFSSLISSAIQRKNAALSLSVIKHLFPQSAQNLQPILERFQRVQFVGRFQMIESNLYIDVAHNPNKLDTVVAEASNRFATKRKIFVIGLSEYRSPQDTFKALLTIADYIIIGSASHKGQDSTFIMNELTAINLRQIPIEIIDHLDDAMNRARQLSNDNSVIIVTGSTFIIDEIFNPDPYMRYLNSSYGWRYENRD